jgi:hypothetical protein
MRPGQAAMPESFNLEHQARVKIAAFVRRRMNHSAIIRLIGRFLIVRRKSLRNLHAKRLKSSQRGLKPPI